MNELQLIADCKDQKRQAQKTIYETHANTMYGICLRYATDMHEAKDWLQDGFIKVFANIASYQGKGSFEGWMRRIFVNLALENLRKSKTFRAYSEDIEKIPDMVDPDMDTESMYAISEESLMAIIRDLPEGYGTVFNLYAIEDYSHREIAEQLNISEGTSRSQYARARRILQDKINEYIKENS